MRKRISLTLIGTACLILLTVSLAQADYILLKDVLSTSGGHLESSSYLLDFSTGQTAVGQSEGTSYIESGGFWNWSPLGPFVAVEDELPGLVPGTYALSQNYPNPFNPETRIQYRLPKASPVSLAIYNVRGQSVRRLVNWEQPAGNYVITWNGLDDAGRPVASGIYFCQLVAGEFAEARKMLLLK
jgi:hypothetical protein